VKRLVDHWFLSLMIGSRPERTASFGVPDSLCQPAPDHRVSVHRGNLRDGSQQAPNDRQTDRMELMPSWNDFQTQAPDLANFGAERLIAAPAYLATIRDVGTPRVHPIAPIIGGGRLLVFMEPTSPKGHDLRKRGWYALHNGVPDTFGSGGEFFVRGQATLLDDPELRSMAAEAAMYQPEDRYILFEFGVDEARCNGYGDVSLPEPRSWLSSQS
jgi:hypothetical protein